MNKHLIDTRMRSIAHYDEEIKKLERALEVTRKTQKEIADSLVEICEWEPGDIIFNGERMRKIISIDGARLYTDNSIRILISFYNQNSSYGWGAKSDDTILSTDLKNWTVIGKIKPA